MRFYIIIVPAISFHRHTVSRPSKPPSILHYCNYSTGLPWKAKTLLRAPHNKNRKKSPISKILTHCVEWPIDMWRGCLSSKAITANTIKLLSSTITCTSIKAVHVWSLKTCISTVKIAWLFYQSGFTGVGSLTLYFPSEYILNIYWILNTCWYSSIMPTVCTAHACLITVWFMSNRWFSLTLKVLVTIIDALEHF